MVTEQELINQLEQATGRLAEALSHTKSAESRDSAILRFILCAELAWKTIKFHLEDNLKIRCTSPKTCFREAYTQKLIEYQQSWLNMIDDRNNVAHLYKEPIAEALYDRLPEYLMLLQTLLRNLTDTDSK